MRIPQTNLNGFKVFAAVFETLSMTEAANVLHLTQSGVSQHIKALEEELGVALFTRVGRKLVPTPMARDIFSDIAPVFERVYERLQKLSGETAEPEGSIRIGMPIEYGLNVVIPKLALIGQKYKKFTFEIQLDHAQVLNNQLMNGDIDFAFVDEHPMDRRIQFEPVGNEELLLCASREYMSRQSKVTYTQSYFENLEYVEYRGAEPILRRWMLHHLKRKNLHLNVRAHIMDVQGVAKFISQGLGVGMLPNHVVQKLLNEKQNLHVFEGKNKPLRNEIRLARLKNHEMNQAAQITLQELKNL
jgi:DNA-binding transcriptional LysR family regulator